MINMHTRLEALLFASGEPLSTERIAKILDIDETEVAAIAAELSESLTGRGIILIENEGSYQLTTSSETSGDVAQLFAEERERSLSKSALEILAIISYEAPITQAQIEMIRGVSSISAIRILLMRGLIERARSSDAAPYEYRPSMDLLTHLGITSLAELPEYESYRNTLKEYRSKSATQ